MIRPIGIFTLAVFCLAAGSKNTSESIHNSVKVDAAQLQRPFIWVKATERGEILQKIDNQPWAKQLFTSLKKRADAATASTLDERREKLMALPLVWSNEQYGTPTLLTYNKDKGNITDKNLRWGHPKSDQINMLKGRQDGVDCSVLYYFNRSTKICSMRS